MHPQSTRRHGAVGIGHGPRLPAKRLTFLALAGALLACSGGGSSSHGQPASPTLSSIALAPGNVTVSAGGQQQFAVVGSYSDHSTAPITSGIDWASSNPSVAAVAASGLATATNDPTSAGTTTITASVAGYSAQASVTVTPAALLAVAIEPPTASVVEASLQAFAAVGHYANGATAPLVNVTWSSSDETVATVDGSGFAAGVRSGGATITATDRATGKSSTASLTITPPVLESIAVSPADATVPAAFSRQFTAIGHFSGGKNPSLSGVTWSSSDAAVASIDAVTGLARGVAPGVVTVTASHSSGKLGTATLTVTAPVPVTEVTPAELPASGGPLAAGGAYPYTIKGLQPGTEYLVRLSSNDATPAELRPSVEVYPDASLGTSWVCSSWAGGPPCRAGVPSATGDLFILVTAAEHASYTLDVKPLPVLVAGGPAVSGSVDATETYYKIGGLPVPGSFQHTLAPVDPSAELFGYDRSGGPFGFTGYPPLPVAGALCSTALEAGPAKGCAGIVPATGEVYVTVEAWMTPAGTDFTLTP
jgi:uncharacterized protein YjdB